MNILLTGVSSGIGYGIAKQYLDEGKTIYGISRTSNDELSKYNNFKFLSLDLSDYQTVEHKLPDFIKDVDMFDKVILNAGALSEVKDLSETPLDEIQKIMNINVWANKILIDLLYQNKKIIRQVIGISSGVAVNGSRGWNAYALSKATLNMLIRLYAKEHTDTHFISLAPGIIDTKMQDYIYSLPDDDKYPTIKQLKSAKGTSKMPGPAEAARMLIPVFEKVKDFESGFFVDVRDIYYDK